MKIEITSKIKATLYEGYLPIAWGHLDPEGGKTWLGVAVAYTYEHKGYGTRIVKVLCEYADKGGWELWLTCPDNLVEWYRKFGFELTCQRINNHEEMVRKVSKERRAEKAIERCNKDINAGKKMCEWI